MSIFDVFALNYDNSDKERPRFYTPASYLAAFIESSSLLWLLWFITKFIDIAADASAQQKSRFSEASDDFKFYDESIQDRESMMTREFVNVARSTENVVARSVANAFGSEKKEIAPRVKKHGWEYKN